MYDSKEIISTLSDLDKQREQLKKKYDSTQFWYFIFPILAVIFSVFSGLVLPALVFVTFAIALISYFVYNENIGRPFDDLSSQMKVAVLKEYMSTFHPEVDFTYHPNRQHVKAIALSSKLLSADEYYEEDVVQGNYGNTSFYLSEVHLKNENEDSSYTVFDGLLFKLNIPGKNFPHTRIQSGLGVLGKLFGGYTKHDKYGFYYETTDESRLHKELESLFPFIQHLMKEQGDLRINVKGDEIILFLESKMPFLDDPKPALRYPLKNTEYMENVSRQMNTLLFIVESFSKNIDGSEIEERLELRTLELAEKLENKYKEL